MLPSVTINTKNIAIEGIKTVSVDSLIAVNTIMQYMKVETYAPKTTWFNRSYMKFLINLGPNCEEAKVKATKVIEKTVPATPIMAPEIVVKILLAESGLLVSRYW